MRRRSQLRTSVTAALVIALPALAARPARAQQEYAQQIRMQLNRVATILRDSGYSPVGDPGTGTLNNGSRDLRPVTLVAGVHYAIVAVCDEDCTILGLALLDPDGSPSLAPVRSGTPLIELTAPRAGQYTIAVTMSACSDNPCYWGVQAFRK